MDFCKFLEHLAVSTVFPPLWNALSAEKEQRNTAEMDFMKEVLVDVNDRMVRLKKLVDEEYMKTEDFKNFLHKMLLKATFDLRREKMKLFANLIVNATLKEFADVSDRWKYLYGETIDKIDVELFQFLLNVKSRCITKGKELDLGWTGKEPELAAMGIDQTTFRMNADYLMSTGLMTRIHQTRPNAQTHSLLVQDEYYVTEFGSRFIGFVREYDSVTESEYEEV